MLRGDSMKTIVEVIDEIGRRNPSFLNERIAAGRTLAQIADEWEKEHILEVAQTAAVDADRTRHG
jgi:hypothetical protein